MNKHDYQRVVDCFHTLPVVSTVKPVLSDHIKQYIFLTFQTCGRLLLHESSAELYALLLFSDQSIAISMSAECMVA